VFYHFRKKSFFQCAQKWCKSCCVYVPMERSLIVRLFRRRSATRERRCGVRGFKVAAETVGDTMH
jgi:hypothetical protein